METLPNRRSNVSRYDLAIRLRFSEQKGTACTGRPFRRSAAWGYFAIAKPCFSHSVMPKAMSLTFVQPRMLSVMVM